MNPIERAKLLADDIRQSEEYKIFAQYKEETDANEVGYTYDEIKSLLREYARMQTQIQLSAAAGQQADADLMQRFSSLSSILYSDPRTSGYLLAQLRLQKLTVDILQIIGGVSGLDLGLSL